MSRNHKQLSKQFKLDAINYRKEHSDLSQAECAQNLGIGTTVYCVVYDRRNNGFKLSTY